MGRPPRSMIFRCDRSPRPLPRVSKQVLDRRRRAIHRQDRRHARISIFRALHYRQIQRRHDRGGHPSRTAVAFGHPGVGYRRWAHRPAWSAKLILFGLVASAVSSLTFGLVSEFAWLFPRCGPRRAAFGRRWSRAWRDDCRYSSRASSGRKALVFCALSATWPGSSAPQSADLSRGPRFSRSSSSTPRSAVVSHCSSTSSCRETKPAARGRMTRKGCSTRFATIRVVLRRQGLCRLSRRGRADGHRLHSDVQLVVGLPARQHGIQPQGYGFLLSRARSSSSSFSSGSCGSSGCRPQFLMMALGTLFYLLGFGMFGLVSAYWLFVLAVVIITMGEMIVMPTSQALAAKFARVDMRGRYMAVFGLTMSVPAAIGPAAAGLVLDNFDGDLLWYLGAILCAISAAGFYVLHLRLGSQPRFAERSPAAGGDPRDGGGTWVTSTTRRHRACHSAVGRPGIPAVRCRRNSRGHDQPPEPHHRSRAHARGAARRRPSRTRGSSCRRTSRPWSTARDSSARRSRCAR